MKIIKSEGALNLFSLPSFAPDSRIDQFGLWCLMGTEKGLTEKKVNHSLGW